MCSLFAAWNVHNVSLIVDDILDRRAIVRTAFLHCRFGFCPPDGLDT